MTAPKEFYTTFEIAQICNFSHTTIINWINKGQLKAHRTPGQHRRIHHSDLRKFLATFDLPIPHELEPSRPKSIVIVDDDADILYLLKRSFDPYVHGLQVRTFTNGMEALVAIGREAPDLVILDIIMPGMDGIQLCRTLKATESTQQLKIIAMTGETLQDDQEAYIRSTVDALFRKPFSGDELTEKALRLVEYERRQHAAKS